MTAFQELSGSPKYKTSRDSGNTAERTFLCAWNDRIAFMEDIANGELPGMQKAYLIDLSAEPFHPELCPDPASLSDPSTSAASYAARFGAAALVRATYGPDYFDAPWPTDIPRPTYDDGTSLKLTVRGTAQFITWKGSQVAFYSNNQKNPNGDLPGHAQEFRQLISIAEYQIEWDYLDDPPVNNFRKYQGCCNSNIADVEEGEDQPEDPPKFLGGDKETILFENWELHPSFRPKPSNPLCWKVAFVFRERRIRGPDDAIWGWNHDLKEKPPAWTRVTLPDSRGPETSRYLGAPLDRLFSQTDTDLPDPENMTD